MFRMSYRCCRLLVACLLCTMVGSAALAELPLARSHSAFPPAAKQGSTVEVTLAGQDLDDLPALRFSDSRIVAKVGSAANKFVVTVPGEVPAGTYDVRAVGRFGV